MQVESSETKRGQTTIAVERLACLLRIWEVPVSTDSPQTGYPNNFMQVSLSLEVNAGMVPQYRYQNIGTTIQVTQYRYHNIGITIQVPEYRYHNTGTTIQVPQHRYHNIGTTIQVPQYRYHHFFPSYLINVTTDIQRFRLEVPERLRE